MESKEIIYRIKSGIRDKDPQAEIILYGSRARGDNRPDSDVFQARFWLHEFLILIVGAIFLLSWWRKYLQKTKK